MQTSPTTISKVEDLADFRQNNTAQAVLNEVNRYKCLLVGLMVGVGKSYNMDEVTEEAVRSGQYDTVIVLAPTRKILEERRLLLSPPSDLKVVNIRRRPAHLCGEERNLAWLSYERRHLGHLGKLSCCKLCPNNSECFWPNQYGKNLEGAQVIYATQTHLVNNPYFIPLLQELTKAKRVLVIFDEANVSLSHYSRTITPPAIEQLLEVLNQCKLPQALVKQTAFFLECLKKSPTRGLQDTEAWSFPRLYPTQMSQLLAIGDTLFGESFINILYDLQAFGYSAPESREKLADGSVRFPAPPFTADHNVLLYSGTTHAQILKLKLGLDFHQSYAGITFRGEGTKWLNLASSIGTASNFKKNAPQILDFYVQLTIQRIREGKRVLLVSKKKHVDSCVTMMNEILIREGVDDIRIVHGSTYTDGGPVHLVPVIHYGVIGTNQYEDFECCYCLNSYYVTEKILSEAIQELRAEEECIEVSIAITDNPKRRRGVIVDPKYRFSDVAMVADPMLQVLEMGTVVQAVGRVRPFTKSREVITFQNNAGFDIEYDKEFSSLTALRAYFDFKTRQERHTEALAIKVHRLIAQGVKQADIAAALGISTRTVRRYKASVPNF